MSESTMHPRDPREGDLRRRLAGLPEAPLDPAVRAALKRSFQEGTLRETGAPSHRRWLAVGAAVAAILVLIWVRHLGPGLRWEVLDQPERITVDGVAYAAEDALDRALARGGVVQLPAEGGSLVLAMERTMVVEVTPGSTLEIPSPTSGSDPIRLAVERGELRALTGPGFAGRRMMVTTPDARVEVTGTIFSVACDDQATCVCVLEGRLRVGADEADLEAIPAGQRKVVFRDDRPSKITDAAPPHVEGLQAFRSRWAGFALEPPRP